MAASDPCSLTRFKRETPSLLPTDARIKISGLISCAACKLGVVIEFVGAIANCSRGKTSAFLCTKLANQSARSYFGRTLADWQLSLGLGRPP